MDHSKQLLLDDTPLTSRFLLGTASYPSLDLMRQAIADAKSEVVTVSLRRQGTVAQNAFWEYISSLPVKVLPNTAGCYSTKEAVTTAQMAREVFATNWIKLEVIGDEYSLQPNPFALLEAATELCKQGFVVFPYCTDDLVLCAQLLEVGCSLLMPWAAPIGSGQGVLNPFALRNIRHRFPNVPIIIDAGIGRPSDAALVMEMGFDAVLINSAVALAHDPVGMAGAFRDAIVAGRSAYEAGIMPKRDFAQPSTPTIDTPFWHQK